MAILERRSRPGIHIIGLFVVIFLFASGAFFWRVGDSAIANADEGVHALVTREIIERPDWVTLHIRGENYFRKPPLSFWIRAATQMVLGENEFSTRFPSVIAGIGTTLLLAVWAWQWTKKWQTVAAVGFMYPLLPSTFLHTFRTGETDGLLLLLLTTCAFLLWKSLRRPWLIIAAGAVTGLAFMTKSVAAGSVPIAFAATLVLARRWVFTFKQVVLAIAAFIVIAAPWHIAEHARHGSTFWNEYIGYHVIERVEERLHVTPKSHGPFWYIKAVENGMYPWSWLVIPALAVAVTKIRRRDDNSITELFLLTWSLGTVVLFSLAQTKLPWYIAPAFSPFVLLVARFVTERSWKTNRGVVLLGGLAISGYVYTTALQYTTGFAGLVSGSFLPSIIIVALIAGLLLAGWHFRRWKNIVVNLALLHLCLFSIITYSRNAGKIYQSPFRVLRDEIVAINKTAEVYIYPIGYITSPLSSIYLEGQNHARRVMALREDSAAVEKILTSAHGNFLITDVDHPVPSDFLTGRVRLVRQYGDLLLYQIQ